MTWSLLAAAPVDPSSDEARSLLRRELLHPEYHQQNVVQQLVDWLARQLERALAAAAHAPTLSTFAAMVVFLVLVASLVWLLTRARGTAAADTPRPVLTGDPVSAAVLRSRAEAALADDRPADAVVDGFRALAVRQVERGRLDDAPGATAHEVADALASAYPEQRGRVDESALLFDLVLYGERPASREQAIRLLALDDELAVLR